MKNVMWILVVAALVACAPAPQEGTSTSGEDAVDVATAGESEDRGEELEMPPEGSVPLSQIIASFEIAGHTSVTEVEFENGVWEVEFVVGGEAFALEIDPMTGEALTDAPHKPDDD